MHFSVYVYLTEQFGTQATLELSDGFKAGQTILKLAGLFWNPQTNVNGFKAAQTILKLAGLFWNPQTNVIGFKAAQYLPCLLWDRFKAISFDSTEPRLL